MRDLIKPILGVVTSWGATVLAWIEAHGVGIVCGILSATASVFAIRAAIETRKLRAVERAKVQYEVCRECGALDPTDCPFSGKSKPKHCLRKFNN